MTSLSVAEAVLRPVSIPKWGNLSEPRFRLIGSQRLRQQILKHANTNSPVGLKAKAPPATSQVM